MKRLINKEISHNNQKVKHLKNNKILIYLNLLQHIKDIITHSLDFRRIKFKIMKINNSNSSINNYKI